MQLLNQKVIFKQLEQLLEHAAKQINFIADPWLKTIPFDRRLFRCSHHKLSAYLADCRQQLRRLQQSPPSEAQLQWQLELLLEQAQALLKAVTSIAAPPSTAALSRGEQLAGYEQRLQEMVTRLELRLEQTQYLNEQQQLLLELEKTQQRLARCQAAQRDHHWKNIVS